MDNEASVIVSPERREFLIKALSVGTIALCAGMLGVPFAGCGGNSGNPVASALPAVGPVIDLAAETGLQPVGGAVKKNITGLNNGKNIIIIRMSATGFAAFTSVCTHQGSEINLPASTGANMVCPSHGSQFRESDGSVAQGPASLPLAKFSAVFDQQKNTLTIS